MLKLFLSVVIGGLAVIGAASFLDGNWTQEEIYKQRFEHRSEVK